MHNGQDNRLTADFIWNCLLKGLDIVERDWRNGKETAGALVIVGRHPKFFSNGLDYENTSKDSGFFPNTFNPFVSRLLSFPIPTVAAVNGHAFAAGFILALACDYRIVTAGKAWCSMNEVFFGAALPPVMCAVLNYKLPSPQAIRKTTLEGHRWTPPELLQIGVADELAEGGREGVLKAALTLAEKQAPLAKTGVFGLMKKDLMKGAMNAAREDNRLIQPADAAALARMRL